MRMAVLSPAFRFLSLTISRTMASMAIKDALLPEYDHELATTRRLLDRVPEAEFGWKPHPKSMTLGQLAGHVANIPFWCIKTLEAPSTISRRRRPKRRWIRLRRARRC